MVNYNSLSPQQKRMVREQYVIAQDNKCYYCKEPLDQAPKLGRKINWNLFPPNFLKYPVHLHHSHNTGECLGAVHARCNAILWQYHGE